MTPSSTEAPAPALVSAFAKLLLEEASAHGSIEGETDRLAVDWDTVWAQSRAMDTPELAIGHALATVAQRACTVRQDHETVSDFRTWNPPDAIKLVALPGAPLAPAEPAIGPGLVEPSSAPANMVLAEPVFTEPAIAEPVPTESAIAEPVPTESAFVEPVPDEPAFVVPMPVHPSYAETSPEEPAPGHLAQEAGVPRVGLRKAVRRRRLAVAASWVRNIGIILILFAGWQLWGTSIEQAHAQQSLRAQFTAKASKAASSFRLAPATARLSQPAEGAVTARLQIPAIGVDQYVVQGTAAADLDKGPGHYIGTALPGQQGNVAIAGHRTTYGAPFDELDKLVVNDPITLTTLSGVRLTYVVIQAPVAVPPTDVAVLNDAGDNRLTLTTCTPKYSATQRLIVVATLRTPTGSPAHRPRRSERVDSGSQGWNLHYLPGVAGLLAALFALGLFHGPIGRRLRGARWIVLTPTWLAGIFFLFVALSGLLPTAL